MAIFDWLFKRRKKVNIEDSSISEDEISLVELKDPSSIQNYVISLCEQMIDVSKDMEEVRREYEQVTAHLNDIQLVEGLEGEQKDQLIEIATQVSKLIHVRDGYLNAGSKISDETFYQMQEEEESIPTIIRRLMDNEKYLDSVKRDLNRLAAEKIEWSVVKQEAEDEQKDLRRMSKMMLAVIGISAIVVVVLSIMMSWNALPIFIVALFATLVASYILIRMQECTMDIRKSELNINRAIVLENRIKIRYVNTKNAIDYTCERFRVKDSKELTYNYEQYLEVCREREKLQQTNEDLDYFTNRLVRILRGLNLYDAKVWVNYANAVIDPKEMVELKHELFTRRQSLRGRIEYNLNEISSMKKEADRYVEKMGDKSAQVREILEKVEMINRGVV